MRLGGTGSTGHYLYLYWYLYLYLYSYLYYLYFSDGGIMRLGGTDGQSGSVDHYISIRN